MINITAIEDELYNSWTNYLTQELESSPQILLANQDIDSSLLQYPRIIYQVTTPYNTSQASPAKLVETVTSDDPNFDSDIEYTYLLNPRLRIEINGYGEPSNPVRDIMIQLRYWFEIEQLGNRFFEDYNAHIMLNQLGNIEDRTTVLNGEYEHRFGFSAIVSVEDRVKVREATVETIELTDQDNNLDTIDT